MSDLSRYQIDTNDYLAYNYALYKSKMYTYAISKPTAYGEMREYAVRKIKYEAVERMFKTVYSVLNQGTVEGGEGVIKIDGTAIKPCYPQQLVSKIALNLSMLLDEELNKVLDIVLPEDGKTLAEKRLATKLAGENIDTPL